MSIYFCPHCKGSVKISDEYSEKLFCSACDAFYPIKQGIPVFEKNISQSMEGYWEAVAPCDILEPYLLEFLPKDRTFENVLDLGSGEGRATAVIVTVATKNVIAVDTSFNSLLRLNEHLLPRVFPVNADAKQLPFPDNYFDLVISLSMVEHIPYDELKIVFLEVFRSLKKEGIFLVRNDAWFYGVLEKLRIRPGQFGRKPDETHINMMTGQRFRHLLEETGFTIVKENHFPFYRYEKKYGFVMPLIIQRIFATHSNFVCNPKK